MALFQHEQNDWPKVVRDMEREREERRGDGAWFSAFLFAVGAVLVLALAGCAAQARVELQAPAFWSDKAPVPSVGMKR